MKDRTCSVGLVGVYISMFLGGVCLQGEAQGITPEELAQKILDSLGAHAAVKNPEGGIL